MSRPFGQNGSLTKYFSKRHGWVWIGRWRVHTGRGRKGKTYRLGLVKDLSEELARKKMAAMIAEAELGSRDLQAIGQDSTLRYRVVLHPSNTAANHGRGGRGAMAEMLVCADLLSKNLEVYRAVNPQAPCDLVVIAEGRAIRVEVKLVQKELPKHALVKLQKSFGKFDVLALVGRDGRVVYIPHAGLGSLTKIEVPSEECDTSALAFPVDSESPLELAA